jgi:hypothetical protein
MDEKTHRTIDAAVKILAILGSCFAFFFGMHQYFAEETKLLEQKIDAERVENRAEFERNLFIRQLDTLEKITESATKVAVAIHAKDDARAQALTQYECIYWEHFLLINNEKLMLAMDVLRDEIEQYEKGYIPLQGLSPEDLVKKRAHEVVIASRRVVEELRKETGIELISSE